MQTLPGIRLTTAQPDACSAVHLTLYFCMHLQACRSFPHRMRVDRRPISFAQINLASQVLVDPWHSGASLDSIKDSGCYPSIFDAPPRPQAYMIECESPRISKQYQAQNKRYVGCAVSEGFLHDSAVGDLAGSKSQWWMYTVSVTSFGP